ncbi:hypothetical protein [Mesonia sp. K7]|uniref:hypothetical protein n=1 Tax=Mesonia sp. K7 TaxID=2218606 RepID=UPI000DA74F15|nr:hypothetical protein [Mesonia sp. K7]PZD76902.1 hypothetical protein DNG35_10465 [Mesonia sp. K7]
MKNTKTIILRKSLFLITNMIENIESLHNVDEFLKIHGRNLKMLAVLAEERNSDFIQKKILEYPSITKTELEYYIADVKGEKSLLTVVAGPVVGFLVNIISTKGKSLGVIKNKLKTIKEINVMMDRVVEDPIFEEVYLKTI